MNIFIMNAQYLKECPESFVTTREYIHNDNEFHFAFGMLLLWDGLLLLLYLINEQTSSQKSGDLHQTMLYWLFKTTMGSMLIAGSHL